MRGRIYRGTVTHHFKQHELADFYESPIWEGLAGVGTLGTSSLILNNLYSCFFWKGQKRTFNRIAIEVTGAITGNARLGVYVDDGNLYPANLVLDAGEIDLSSTGVKELTISSPLVLPENRIHWLAYLASATATIRVFLSSNDAACPIMGFSSFTQSTWQTGWYKSQVYGSLPNPFPAGASNLYTAPHIILRKV